LSCQIRADLPTDPKILRQTLCSEGTVDCLRAIDSHFLAHAPPGVAREGDKLIIQPRSGRPIEMEDSGPDAEGASVGIYGYNGFVTDLQSHLVEVQFYEGGKYLLVSRDDGKVTDLDDAPILSPDRLRFVTSSGGGHTLDRVQVWRVAPQGIELEFSYSACGWSPGDAKWLTNREIEITKALVDPSNADENPSVSEQRAHLRLEEDGWWVYDKTR